MVAICKVILYNIDGKLKRAEVVNCFSNGIFKYLFRHLYSLTIKSSQAMVITSLNKINIPDALETPQGKYIFDPHPLASRFNLVRQSVRYLNV